MEWTREQRYRKIEDVTEKEILELEQIVKNSPWRQKYHIQPKTGLLNDPNGFAYYNGEYHLFYQWFPLGSVHGLKYWYHMKSKNLIEWEDSGIAIRPSSYFDSHGAYSGSALEHDEKLYLFYTGNSRDDKWVRHPFQCLAIMNKSGQIKKLEKPVINQVPEGYSDHFRDPKLWKHDNKFYAIIGAQRVNQTGCIVLYSSLDMLEWIFEGEIRTNFNHFGYMWECPDYFELHNNGVLIFSPQGLTSEGDNYRNIYQSGYLLGNKLDFKKKSLEHGDFVELDRGFDFYAPQTTTDPLGRRLLVGWMGLPDIEYPTDPFNWAHCLTLPRELSIRCGKIIQKPIKELELLRKKSKRAEGIICNESRVYPGFSGITYELICEFHNENADEFGIEFRTNQTEKTILKYNANEKKVIFDRTYSGEPVGTSYGTIRKCSLKSAEVKVHMFVDVSSVEIFINDGEEVFTSRIFPKKDSEGIHFFAIGGKTSFKCVKWDYKI